MAGIGGFANILTSDVTIEESTVFPSPRENYFEMVGITAHEVGHQTFRYAEERYLGWAPWNGASYETTVREEAVAVLFRALVGSQLSDPGERFLVIGNIQTLAEKHYEGKQDYGLNEGAALADAALTLYSDPRQAYAAMTTPGPLDPALRAIIEENRTLYLEVKALMKEDARNSQNLREKLQQIIDSK